MHLLQKFNAQQVSIGLREPLFCFESTEDFLDKGDPVYRIIFDTQGAHLSYKVGDALGVFPQNSSQIVGDILSFLHYTPSSLVSYSRVSKALSIENLLTSYLDLDKIPTKLLSFFPELDPKTTLYDAIKEFQPSIPVEVFVNSAYPLLPRLYSIASSPHVHPNQIELLVRRVSYQGKFQKRYGVCSTFLCETLTPGKDSLFVYIQPTRLFTLSEESQNRPIVMIGSGTGIAPFKGFMEQRLLHENSYSKNLLFFGERQKVANFYYQEFWNQAVKQGALHVFSAFSREGNQKFYVQDALREQKELVKKVYEEGAIFFVCGRKVLGAEVKNALEDILGKESVSSLRKEQRYIVDVY